MKILYALKKDILLERAPGQTCISNDDCQEFYIRFARERCTCPPGRCWYKEQQARRRTELEYQTFAEWERANG